MPAMLYGLFTWAFSGMLQMVLAGAGLSLITFVGLQPLVQSFFDTAVSKLNGLPEATLQFLLLCGLGDALTIIVSAILTRIAFTTASRAFSLGMPTRT